MRRVKNPNRELLLELGAWAEAGLGPVLVLLGFRSCVSGVGPRAAARVTTGNAEEGFGEGFREDIGAGTPNLELAAVVVLDSVDTVRLWWDGKFSMLLWIIGEGPRSPDSSGVPSLLGLEGLLPVGIVTGD